MHTDNFRHIHNTTGRLGELWLHIWFCNRLFNLCRDLLLSRLSWNDGDFEILKEQWELVNEMPEVPGGYYIPRVVDQAFWNVVGNGKGIEEMLLKWDKVADTEIAEKRSQYN